VTHSATIPSPSKSGTTLAKVTIARSRWLSEGTVIAVAQPIKKCVIGLKWRHLNGSAEKLNPTESEVEFENKGLPSKAIRTDSRLKLGYIAGVNSDPLEINEKTRAEYHARWEAVEIFRAHEIAAMTEARALEIIQTLKVIGPASLNPFNGEGLVEQQDIFHGRNK
jgi:hypothetical protein